MPKLKNNIPVTGKLKNPNFTGRLGIKFFYTETKRTLFLCAKFEGKQITRLRVVTIYIVRNCRRRMKET